MKNGKIQGLRSFKSKNGNDIKLAYFTYEDKQDKETVGFKTGSAFLSDEIVESIGNKNVIGASIVITGRYDKNGNWKDVISSVKA